MNEQLLRDALRAEVDEVHASADAFARLETRLPPGSRRPVRGMIIAGVGVVLLAALVAGAVAATREPKPHPSAAAPSTVPRRIVAVTSGFRLVVLDSRTGRTVRDLGADVGTFRGAPEVAASPDGAAVFFTGIDPVRPPGCRTAGQETVFRVPVKGGTPTVVTRGRTVAVSGSGELARPPGTTSAAPSDRGCWRCSRGRRVIWRRRRARIRRWCFPICAGRRTAGR